jgi:hypothetical protein
VPTGSNKALIIGAAIGGSVLLSLLVLVGVYALHQKKRADKTLRDSILLVRPSITKKMVEDLTQFVSS